ncbi:hypothetical protein IFM89_019055 [Coptis chinensis]|uniref:Uncharacterized protein n=1 Tax=Coptis chinensis TaxID=261450 RepID=A0A835MA85_9MAGN|nr:hypothetical protein IFM89_019055 [Coptis chinensis]
MEMLLSWTDMLCLYRYMLLNLAFLMLLSIEVNMESSNAIIYKGEHAIIKKGDFDRKVSSMGIGELRKTAKMNMVNLLQFKDEGAWQLLTLNQAQYNQITMELEGNDCSVHQFLTLLPWQNRL